MKWRIDQAEGMPAVEFLDDRCIVTFTVMPTPKGLATIIEVTEQAIASSNQLRLARGMPAVHLEYRLPAPQAK